VDAYQADGPAVQSRIDQGGVPAAATAAGSGGGGSGLAGSGSGSGAGGLPFTGGDLFAIAAAGLLLLALGVFLRRLTPPEEA
jgi:hypothetical protein